jgi:hypothetical protein
MISNIRDNSWYDMCCEDDPNFDNESWENEECDDERSYVQGIRQNSCPLNITRINDYMISEIIKKNELELEKEQIEKENELYQNNVVSKLSWFNKSPTKRKFENTIHNSIMDTDDYPCLGLNPKKKKIETIIEKEPTPIVNEEWIEIKKKEKKVVDVSKNIYTCTKLCSSIDSGKKCNNKICSYAHSIDELRINDCKFQNCNMVFSEDGYFFNTNKNKICNNIHSNESKTNYLERVSFQKNDEKQPFKKIEKTQLCKLFKEKKCSHGNNCRFAHSFVELTVNDCSYGDKCKGIQLQNGIYVNMSTTRVCSYKHPYETKENYKNRVFN